MQLMASSTSSTSSSVEVPQFFLCPISLQIMKDPVTTVTGITYDRTSIERWLFSDNNTTCPLTNQPIIPNKSSFSNSHIDNNNTYTLLPDILTPNHTLRRLIQAWCTTNSVDRIPTPRPPIDRLSAAALLFDLSHPDRQLKSLNLMAALVHESQSNRRTFVNLDAARFLLKTVVSCSNKHQFDRVDLALNVVLALRIPNDELEPLVVDNYQLLDALGQVLLSEPVRSGSVVLFLKTVTELASASLLERLKPEFVGLVVGYIKDRHHVNKHVTRAALQVLLSCCPWGRNRIKMVEAGAVNELIELELNNGLKENKRCTEIVMGLLEHLCGCADGRAELVGHPAGISVVAKRILRVSPLVDEAAVGILSVLARNSATGEVLMEMLSVGAVSKLCFVLQADCSNSVREKARWVLRLHSGAWKNSECISMNLLTIYP